MLEFLERLDGLLLGLMGRTQVDGLGSSLSGMRVSDEMKIMTQAMGQIGEVSTNHYDMIALDVCGKRHRDVWGLNPNKTNNSN